MRTAYFGGGGGGGSSSFAPFDNSFYFDPAYTGSSANGSIKDPYLSWAEFVAAAGGSTVGTQVYFPGYPVTPDEDEIPTDKLLVIQGQHANEASSYINDFVTLGNNGGLSQYVEFNDIKLEGIHLTGGNFPIRFSRCEVAAIDEVVSGTYGGVISGFDSAFLPSQDTVTATVKLTGGYVTSWSALSFDFTDMFVGTPDGATAGNLIASGTLIICRSVTFAPNSTIEFSGDEGELFLDPESYKSFLDNDIGLNNGHVTRLDGSWPRDAITYNDGDPINWAKNPRAIYNSTDGSPLVFSTNPLTREVQLLVMYQTGGEGGSFSWPDTCRFTDGLEPDQVTTDGSMSLFRLDWEETLGFYVVWAVAMNIQGL